MRKLEDLHEKGKRLPGDCGYSANEQPDWLNLDQFRAGQDFFVRHVAKLAFAMHCSLAVGFSMNNLLVPLVYTDMSETPKKSFKRYFMTFEYLRMWHTGNVWDPKSSAHKAVQRVRNMHNKVARNMTKSPPEEKIETGENGLRRWLSQYDMATVQSGFFGAIVMYPAHFGLQTKRSELEAYVHFWRGIGYLLGIHDDFNLCTNGLEEALSLVKEIEQTCLLPALKSPPPHFQHMSQAYMDGVNSELHFPFYSMPSVTALSLDAMGEKWPLGFIDWLRYLMLKLFLLLLAYSETFENYVNKQFGVLNKKYKAKYNFYL